MFGSLLRGAWLAYTSQAAQGRAQDMQQLVVSFIKSGEPGWEYHFIWFTALEYVIKLK